MYWFICSDFRKLAGGVVLSALWHKYSGTFLSRRDCHALPKPRAHNDNLRLFTACVPATTLNYVIARSETTKQSQRGKYVTELRKHCT
jgi:hypothetical protein